MGSGLWSTNVYTTKENYRRATGTSAFAYSDSGARKVHEKLDPYAINVRESRDSDEHPNSLPIAVLFDVTGSMLSVPRVLQTKLPELFGLLLRKGYVQDPQVLFGAIGDATCDRVPLQIGQFESDNRCDEDLEKIVLEGGGGGQMTESYELAMYLMARHTSTDAWEKRGKKGYIFLMGDELAYSKVKAHEVKKHIGDVLPQDIPIEDIVTELKERWEVYYIIPSDTSHANDRRLTDFWRKLLGQNVLMLDDLDAVCETIALTIGLAEGTVDLDAGLADLDELGSTSGASVAKTLAHIAPPSATVNVSLAAAASSGSTRL